MSIDPNMRGVNLGGTEGVPGADTSAAKSPGEMTKAMRGAAMQEPSHVAGQGNVPLDSNKMIGRSVKMIGRSVALSEAFKRALRRF